MPFFNTIQSSASLNSRQAKGPLSYWICCNSRLLITLRQLKRWPEVSLLWTVISMILGQATAMGLITQSVTLTILLLLVVAIYRRNVLLGARMFLGLCLVAVVSFFVLRLQLPSEEVRAWAGDLVADDEDFTQLQGTVVSTIERPSAGVMRFLYEANISASARARFMVSSGDLPWLSTSRIRQGQILDLLLKNRYIGIQSEESPLTYQASLSRRGIIAISHIEKIVNVPPPVSPSKYEEFLLRVVAALGGTDSAAVLLAITIGFEDMLSAEILHIFRETGTTHVLVVSGFHIAVIYGLIYAILYWIVLRIRFLMHYLPARVPAAVGALICTFFYGALTGGGVPTSRAIFLLSLLCLGATLGRSSFSLRNFLFAIAAVLIFWPGAFLEAGFQLTFSAVAGLLLAQHVARVWQPRRKWLGYCYSALLANTFAWLATMPVVVLWFWNWVPLSPLINALIVPMFTLISTGAGGFALLGFYVGLPGSLSFLRAVDYLTELLLSCLATANLFLNEIGLGVTYLSPDVARSFGLSLLALYLPLVLIILRLTKGKMASRVVIR